MQLGNKEGSIVGKVSASVSKWAVPYNWESAFHRRQRSKAWPWQNALVHTALFDADFYGC